MVIFAIFLKTKSDPNIRKTHNLKKKFSGDMQISKS